MNEQLLYQAVGLHQAGKLAGAVRLYGEFLRANPGHFQALYMLGFAHHQSGQFEACLQAMTDAARANPRSPDAHFMLGSALQRLNQIPEALASFDRALALRPGFVDALVDKSAALLGLQRHPEALAAADAALAADPKSGGAWNNRGCVFQRVSRHEDALAAFEKALALDPQFTDALINRGASLFELKRYEDAARDYDEAVRRDASRPYLKGNRLLYHLYCCDWRDFEQHRAAIEADVTAGEPAVLPFVHTVLSGDAAAQLKSARIWAARELPRAATKPWRGEAYRHERIRIAYVSGDFRPHPVAFLIAGVFEHHDRARFETIGVSLGAAGESELRTRIAGGLERFIDARAMTDFDVATMLRKLEVDIAVDLMGFTEGCRTGIFAHRLAPVQVNYLGYPGTLGAGYFDYLLADRVVIPQAERASYSEQIVYLPDSYQANDSKRAIAARKFTRKEAGLPEEGIVFSCFNATHKILPEMFEIWMRIVRAVPGSVLWLLEDNALVAANLRREAKARGVAPERLVFAPRVAAPEHLARQGLADLFLDTLPYNAHVTASDALWAGLPVLTCTGQTFASRVGASLLTAAGLPELITHSLADYEALALKLAGDAPALAAIKAKLAATSGTCALFDTARITRHLETAYTTMCERQRGGERPMSFAVAPS